MSAPSSKAIPKRIVTARAVRPAGRTCLAIVVMVLRVRRGFRVRARAHWATRLDVVVAVYRVRNNGFLRALRRPPKALMGGGS